MLAGVVSGTLHDLIVQFDMMKTAGIVSGKPPVGGTHADTINWYKDAVNLGLTSINDAGVPAGYPAFTLAE